MTVLTVLIKITEHRLIHMGVVLKSWSKVLNLKPFVMLLTRKRIQNCL